MPSNPSTPLSVLLSALLSALEDLGRLRYVSATPLPRNIRWRARPQHRQHRA